MVADQLDDMEFGKLFRSFDNVVAPRELREATIAAMCAQEGLTEEGAIEATAVVQRPQGVEGASAPRVARARRTARPSSRLRVVAFASLACALVFALGAASWFVPVSTMRVEQDDFVVDLGVNVFGVTVSAEASGQEAQEVLALEDVRNLTGDEAKSRLISALDRMRVDRAAESASDHDQRTTQPANPDAGAVTGAEGVAQVRPEDATQAPPAESAHGWTQAPPEATVEPQQPTQPTTSTVPADAGATQQQPAGDPSQQTQTQPAEPAPEQTQPTDGQQGQTHADAGDPSQHEGQLSQDAQGGQDGRDPGDASETDQGQGVSPEPAPEQTQPQDDAGRQDDGGAGHEGEMRVEAGPSLAQDGSGKDAGGPDDGR